MLAAGSVSEELMSLLAVVFLVEINWEVVIVDSDWLDVIGNVAGFDVVMLVLVLSYLEVSNVVEITVDARLSVTEALDSCADTVFVTGVLVPCSDTCCVVTNAGLVVLSVSNAVLKVLVALNDDVSKVAIVDSDKLVLKEVWEYVPTVGVTDLVKTPSDVGFVEVDILCMMSVCSCVLLTGSDEVGKVVVTIEDNVFEVVILVSGLVSTFISGDVTGVEIKTVDFVKADCSVNVELSVNSVPTW